MRFLAGDRLWLLVLPLGLAAAYVASQVLRRRTYAVRFTNVDLLAKIAPKRPGWRRHVTAGVLLASLVALAVGFARPVVDHRVPRQKATVMLAIDVSESMAADDVSPTRLAAAQAAAKQFVNALPATLNLGLVSFSGNANLLVPPTTDRAAVRASIDRLQLGPRTAIGEAIYTSLDAIASLKAPAVIVLMSDGTTTTGRPDTQAAGDASKAGVPVTTIAYGTDHGTVDLDGQRVAVPVDKTALQDIANATGGKFFEAADAGQLQQVYKDIGKAVGYETKPREVTAAFTGIGLVLVAAAAGSAIFWMSRLL